MPPLHTRYSAIRRIIAIFGHLFDCHLNYMMTYFCNQDIDYKDRKDYHRNIIYNYSNNYQEFNYHNVTFFAQDKLDILFLYYKQTNKLKEIKDAFQDLVINNKDTEPCLTLPVIHSTKNLLPQISNVYHNISYPYKELSLRHDLVYRNATCITLLTQYKKLYPDLKLKDVIYKPEAYFKKDPSINFEPDFSLQDKLFVECDMGNHTISSSDSKIMRKLKNLKQYYHDTNNLTPYIYISFSHERNKKIMNAYSNSNCPLRNDPTTNNLIYFTTFDIILRYFLGGKDIIKSKALIEDLKLKSSNIFKSRAFFNTHSQNWQNIYLLTN